MGNCASSSSSSSKYSLDSAQSFFFKQVIGKGGFGKVWNVIKKKNKQQFAMKVMSKVKILSKKSVNSVLNERKILAHLSHPLIVNMHSAFQDRENLYLTMDLIDGGDLRHHLNNKHKNFTEPEALFIGACIISALEYIHSRNILHRDLKPENLIFNLSGYLKITDFGISRAWRPDNSSETSGTPGYIAPEVLMKQNYGVAVDYYALGIILYELALGRRPYKAKDRKELRDQIMAKQVQIKIDEIPKGWSLESIDFINRRKPQNRLGVNGPAEVKEHKWVKSFPWIKLKKYELEAPFKPPEGSMVLSSQTVLSQQNEVDKQNAILLRKDEVQQLFLGYDFDSSKQKIDCSENSTPFTSFTSNSNNSNKKDSQTIEQEEEDQDQQLDHQQQQQFKQSPTLNKDEQNNKDTIAESINIIKQSKIIEAEEDKLRISQSQA